MAALTLYVITDAGTAPTFAAPAASQTALIGSGTNTFLVVRNTSATAVNVTVVAPGNTSYGQPMPDPVINVPITTGEKWIPIRKAYDDGTGYATITTDAQPAGCTCALVQMG